MPTDEPSIYCIDCGYPLNHLPDPRCPECGRDFDPDDSKTFLPITRHAFRQRKATAILFRVIIAACMLPFLAAVPFIACALLAEPCINTRGMHARSDVGRVGNLSKQLELYRADVGRYPTTKEGLAPLLAEAADVDDPRHRGPYIVADMLIDPWGNPYQYMQPGAAYPGGFDLWSCGPDGFNNFGLPGTDDIGNWQQ